MSTKELLLVEFDSLSENKQQELLKIAQSMKANKIDMELWVKNIRKTVGTFDFSHYKPMTKEEIHES